MSQPPPQEVDARPGSGSFENTMQHMKDVTQEIYWLQINLAEKSKLLEGEIEEKKQIVKQIEYLEANRGPAVQQVKEMKASLWALYNELQRNLDKGKPRPITEASITTAKKEVEMEIENETAFWANKYEEASKEIEEFHAQLDQVQLPENAIAQAQSDAAKLENLRETKAENERLDMENSRLAEEKHKLEEMLEFTLNPWGSITKTAWSQFSKGWKRPLRALKNEIHMTSTQCESNLQDATMELLRQKEQNHQLQNGVQILENGQGGELLHGAVKTFFTERGQLTEAMAAFQHREEDIVQQISALTDLVFLPEKETMLLPSDASTRKSSQDGEIEIQQIYHIVEKIQAGMSQFLDYQDATINKIRDETVQLLNFS